MLHRLMAVDRGCALRAGRPSTPFGPWGGIVLLTGLVACGGSKQARPPQSRSAILITLDTTNAGALDCYGRDRGLTPNLATFAADSIVFDEARTVAPLTLPAHASMLTGLTPARHTVRDNSLSRVPEDAETVAELAKNRGYATAAFVSAAVLSAPYGLDQGFDVYEGPAGSASTVGAHMVERIGSQTTRAAQDWLAARDSKQPFFLWVHYFDPHAPYDPPADFLESAGGKPYLGEVAFMDQAVGDLLGSIRADGLLDDVAVVIAGDHGEALGRHGEPTHSLLCYDEVMRIPLLVRPPGGVQTQRRDGRLSSVVDVAPTLQALMGLAEPAMGQDGRDLLGSPPGADHSVYFESWTGYLSFGFSPLVGAVQGNWKYIHTSDPELFNLEENPREEGAQVQALPNDRAEHFQKILRARLRAPALQASQIEGGAANLSDVMALGYAGSGIPDGPLPDPLEPTDLPAPQRSVNQMNATYAAILLAQAGERDQAIEQLSELVSGNQGNVYAATMLGGFLLEEQRFTDAKRILEGLVAGGHERPLLRHHAGRSCEALGLFQEALDHYRKELEMLPNDPAAAEHVARMQRQLADRR